MIGISPQWPAPAAVAAVTTVRSGGASAEPFADFNLAAHVGDEPAAVAANRQRLLESCPGLSAIGWLQQVHGTDVVAADASATPVADAVFTQEPGLGCAVLTADCLPVLFCDRAGTRVAAAHAGWRGLGDGVLERTVAALSVPAGELLAWLGPAIGPAHFEVGPEVRARFLDTAEAALRAATEQCFVANARPGHFLADLYQLARLRLRAAGVEAVYGGGFCTFAEPERFYSYRREPVTGRMASLIYLIPGSETLAVA
jgi:YfiH family protein